MNFMLVSSLIRVFLEINLTPMKQKFKKTRSHLCNAKDKMLLLNVKAFNHYKIGRNKTFAGEKKKKKSVSFGIPVDAK